LIIPASTDRVPSRHDGYGFFARTLFANVGFSWLFDARWRPPIRLRTTGTERVLNRVTIPTRFQSAQDAKDLLFS
jgi:hypothetical protein